ncbi:MAG TPA: hypothetical protein DGT21_24020 [Armatimonadetes bacterium]|nr:hypothetical protein [Armatimonadota bacterium]
MSGSLVDVLLGVGLSEVVVEVGGKTAKSDENGLFQVKGVPLGSQLLSVTLDPRLGSALVAEPPSTVDVSAPRTDLEPFYTVSDALAPPEAPGW